LVYHILEATDSIESLRLLNAIHRPLAVQLQEAVIDRLKCVNRPDGPWFADP